MNNKIVAMFIMCSAVVALTMSLVVALFESLINYNAAQDIYEVAIVLLMIFGVYGAIKLCEINNNE